MLRATLTFVRRGEALVTARDGRLYWLTDDEPDAVHVSIMNSWQPDDGDLRC